MKKDRQYNAKRRKIDRQYNGQKKRDRPKEER